MLPLNSFRAIVIQGPRSSILRCTVAVSPGAGGAKVTSTRFKGFARNCAVGLAGFGRSGAPTRTTAGLLRSLLLPFLSRAATLYQ